MTIFPAMPGHSLCADRSIKIPTIQVGVVAIVVPPSPVMQYRTIS